MEKIQVNYEEMYNRSDEIEFLKKQFEQYKKEAYFFNSSAEEVAFLYNLGLFFSEYYEKNIDLKHEEYIQYIFRNANDYYYSVYCYLQGKHLFSKKLKLKILRLNGSVYVAEEFAMYLQDPV